MARQRRRQLTIGLEGLALCRELFTGDESAVQRRLQEIAHLLVAEDPAFSEAFDAPEMGVPEGYAAWSTTYDDDRNAVVDLDAQVVQGLLREAPAGIALDAACGTGRYATLLCDLGHQVLGVDRTPEMLARAQANVPAGSFALGTLEALPVPDGRFDLALCNLALTHCRDLALPVSELARAVRPGGRIIISDVHPTFVLLGTHAGFQASDGSRGFVWNHYHPVGSYLNAFSAAGLAVSRCIEPQIRAEEAAYFVRRTPELIDAAVAALVGIPAVLVWDLQRTGPARSESWLSEEPDFYALKQGWPGLPGLE